MYTQTHTHTLTQYNYQTLLSGIIGELSGNRGGIEGRKEGNGERGRGGGGSTRQMMGAGSATGNDAATCGGDASGGELEYDELVRAPIWRVSIGTQSPAIVNATIRDNVLFGADYEPGLYRQCLEGACLVQDLSLFPGGDSTEIGEKGVSTGPCSTWYHGNMKRERECVCVCVVMCTCSCGGKLSWRDALI